MRRGLIFFCLALSLGASQAVGTPPGNAHAQNPSDPAWRNLTEEQHEALAPLAGEWDSYDRTRKRKWLKIAERYRNLSPEGKKRLQERMPELAHLSPEERIRTRQNFQHAYTLSPEEREAKTQGFQELPDDKKKALAAKATERQVAPTPRRAGSSNAPGAPVPAAPPHP